MKHLKHALPTELKSVLKITRASVTLACGSSRYANPSLNNIADKLEPYLPPKGTFLEIGANDGYSQSNTYHLEFLRGWTGVLIEPNPRLYQICRLHRRRAQTYQVACISPGGPSIVELSNEGLTSTVLGSRAHTSRRIRVPTSTLSTVIDESSLDRITFMSIDVEGAELEVLGGLDLSRHAPDLLLVETSQLGGVTDLLQKHYAPPVEITHHDYLFVALNLANSN